MDTINISGQNLSIGQSLQEYVEERLNHTIKKYFDSAPSAHIHFTRSGYEFACDIIVNDGTGRHTVIKAHSSSDDIYSAFDSALGKIGKQLRKYKSKLQNRGDKIKLGEALAAATTYTIEARSPEDKDFDSEVDVDNPVIIAEKPTSILNLSVGEAVMHMDLQNLPALMFKNTKTGRINIVYYRRDGNISWVDSN